MTDREQIRREAEEAKRCNVGWSFAADDPRNLPSPQLLADYCLDLLSELGRVERSLERQVPILVEQRDFAERQRDEAHDRLEQLIKQLVDLVEAIAAPLAAKRSPEEAA